MRISFQQASLSLAQVHSMRFSYKERMLRSRELMKSVEHGGPSYAEDKGFLETDKVDTQEWTRCSVVDIFALCNQFTPRYIIKIHMFQ